VNLTMTLTELAQVGLNRKQPASSGG